MRDSQPIMDEMIRQINKAASRRCKVAMFHYQVLVNADKLADEDPVHFCRAVGMNDSFAIEFRKMLNLSRMMKQMEAKISLG